MSIEHLKRLILDEREAHGQGRFQRAVNGKDTLERSAANTQRMSCEHAQAVTPELEPKVTTHIGGPKALEDSRGPQRPSGHDHEAQDPYAPGNRLRSSRGGSGLPTKVSRHDEEQQPHDAPHDLLLARVSRPFHRRRAPCR